MSLGAVQEESRVDEQDILEAARQLHGLENLDQVKFARRHISLAEARHHADRLGRRGR